jgi:hypothetical protein
MPSVSCLLSLVVNYSDRNADLSRSSASMVLNTPKTIPTTMKTETLAHCTTVKYVDATGLFHITILFVVF